MTRHPRRNRNSAGFTLIEMIVAAILLVLGVTAAMTAIGASTRTSAHADQIQTASLLAQRQIAEAETQPDSLSGGDQEGQFDEPYAIYHWKQSVEATDFQNLFKVTVNISWGEPSRPYERSLTTFLRNDQNTVVQQSQQNKQAWQTAQSQQSSGSATTGGSTSGP